MKYPNKSYFWCDSKVFQCHRPGIILMVVLGFTLLIAIFVTQFMEIMERQIRNQVVELARSELRLTAYSVLEVALAVLSEYREIEGELYSPAQGWGNVLNHAQITWPKRH